MTLPRDGLTVTPDDPPFIVVVMEWPQTGHEIHAEISAAWREHPERLDAPVRKIALTAAGNESIAPSPQLFYLKNVKPGVYTLILRYRASSQTSDVRPTVYLLDDGALNPRALKPVSFSGVGQTTLAKVLLPYGVLWDQDDWFTGKAESVGTITKFRLPEAITWVERKTDLQ